MTRTWANQWDDPPHLDNRLSVILLISFSNFCYKLSIFGNFILQNIEVDLYTETLKLALFWLQNGGRLIHRFHLYTGKCGITIPNDTKKATKLGMKVYRGKQCFNTQFAHMSSVCPHSLSQSWSPNSADASFLEQQLSCHSSISKSHPSQFNFHWAKHLHSRKFECCYLH